MPDYTLSKEYPLMVEQNEMIDFAIKRPYAIISGQTGLGKTYTAVTLAAQLMIANKDLFTIILAPPKAIMSFEKELSQKLKVSYSILSTEKTVMNPNARFMIVSYTKMEDAFGYFMELKKKWKLLGICDEAHQLQNHQSAIFTKFLNIRKLFAILYFLTATSCKNNIEGMFWMISLLNPQIFGSWSSFKSKYLIINKKKVTQTTKRRTKIQRTIEEIVGYKNLELLQVILGNIVIVRQKEYKLEFTYHTCELNDYEKDLYLNASKGNESENAQDFWSVRLRDITMVVDNIPEDVSKRETISNKERLLLKVLLANLKAGRPTLVYCGYIEVLERLKFLIEHFRAELGVSSVLVIKGSVSMAERKKIQDMISVDRPCLITSAGGESVNLQKANSIIFYDLPYDISAIMQVIGRITRVDTKFDRQYIDIIEAFGTTDTYKRLCMEKNMKLVESLFGKMNTLPYTTYNNEQKFMSTLRKSLLWAFKKGSLVTKEELDDIFQKFNAME